MLCRTWLVAAAAALALQPRLAPGQPSFTPLGVLPGTSSSRVYGLSPDGRIVVGSSGVLSEQRAFAWTADGGLVGLETPAGAVTSWATAASNTGLVVGTTAVGGLQAFIWSEADGMQGLGWLEGSTESVAWGISADGAAIVGTSTHLSGFPRATVWAAGGSVHVPPVEYTQFNEARGVSADGSVVVGASWGDGAGPAYRWTAAGGPVPLEPPNCIPWGGCWGYISVATAVSGDGSTVVGHRYPAQNDPPFAPFRWTAQTGLVELAPAGPYTTATAASYDGSVVVGYGWDEVDGYRAWIWTPVHGLRRLEHVLQNELGVDLGGWALAEATAVSADGRTIAGAARHPERGVQGWVASLGGACAADWNGDRVVTSVDISAYLTAWLADMTGGTTLADFDGSGGTDSSDITAFLTAWLADVAGGC